MKGPIGSHQGSGGAAAARWRRDVDHDGVRQQEGWLAGQLADWDLLVLLLLILADIRVFQGNPVASFTLYELFAWLYCAPYVLGYLLASRHNMAQPSVRFIATLGCYVGWLLVASLFALFGRQHSDVAQQAKNILPALPLACFLVIRLVKVASIARLANLYVLYCCVSGVLAVVQHLHGSPYFRPLIENNEYKLDFGGDLITNLALGFAGTPNELAVAVLPGVMFAVVKLFDELRGWRMPRPLTVLCCALAGAAFLLADSRGAAAWFVFGLAFIAGPARRSRSFSLKLAAVAGLIGLLVCYGMSVPTSAVEVGNTVQVRVLLWQTSLAAMVNDPYVALLGDGMGYVQTWSWQTAGWEFPDAHNGWLDQALFFGVPALLLYLSIWRCFFAIVDAQVHPAAMPAGVAVLLNSVRGSILAFMGLYFFEPVAHAVFPVSQLILLMSCGVAMVNISKAELPM